LPLAPGRTLGRAQNQTVATTDSGRCSRFINDGRRGGVRRLPQTGEPGVQLTHRLADKLLEHKQYIDENGQDLPKIRSWTWGVTAAATGE
jgi:phosphoketolase